jgi:hypothetical protein
VRVCTTDAFTDCASRERVQWMEDLYLHGRVAAYAFGDTRLLRRALFQGAQNALPDGRINGFMPSERTNCAVAPCPGALTWASGEVPTPHGRLAVRWRREADGRLDVNIDQAGGRAYLQERRPNGEIRLCLKEERPGGLGAGLPSARMSFPSAR